MVMPVDRQLLHVKVLKTEIPQRDYSVSKF